MAYFRNKQSRLAETEFLPEAIINSPADLVDQLLDEDHLDREPVIPVEPEPPRSEPSEPQPSPAPQAEAAPQPGGERHADRDVHTRKRWA